MMIRAASRIRSASDDWASLCAEDAATLCPDVIDMIDRDRALEERSLNFIASASYAPRAPRQIEGSHLVNRAPMGVVGGKSVGNSGVLDEIETIANVGVMRAILPASGGRVLTFDEAAGGHVSHATDRHISSLSREVRSFGVTPDGSVNYEQARAMARDFRPDVILAGPSSYPREIDYPALRAIGRGSARAPGHHRRRARAELAAREQRRPDRRARRGLGAEPGAAPGVGAAHAP